MSANDRLHDLLVTGRLQWDDASRAWIGPPDDVVQALSDDGFEECKRETARTPGGRPVSGGLWQGLDRRTGSVASVVWVAAAPPRALVFVDIDGERVRAATAVGAGRRAS